MYNNREHKGYNDSKVVIYKQPCNNCGSSDAKMIYDDNHSYCYSCKKYLKEDDSIFNMDIDINKQEAIEPIEEYTKEYLPWRNILKGTMKTFKVQTLIDSDGVPMKIAFPYGEGFKVRSLEAKNFFFEGNHKTSTLFGRELWDSGEARSITITEGELDAMSAYQMLGSKYPVVSVRGASSARRDCEKEFEFLNSFDRIYFCFDNDKAGTEALKDAASLFDVNKVYHVKLDKYKDANEYLMNGASEAFVKVWWNAKRYLPKGIIGSYDDVFNILSGKREDAIGTYPHETLQNMSFGIRPGEVTLVTALEKVGKTEFMRSIEYHLLKTTDYNMGIIHLEEGEKRCVQGLVGYHLGEPVHLPTSTVSIDDQLKAYQELTKVDGRVFYYSHFGSDDPDVILNSIRYMAGVCGCKFIFLDHISMIVSGHDDNDDERRKLDYISTRLKMMAKEMGFALILVSHVNDHGQTRGSRNISKVADLIIHLSRNNESADENERNRMHLMIKGNRFGSFSGPAGVLLFDMKTFRLNEETELDRDVPKF